MGEQRRFPRQDTLNILHFLLLGPGAPFSTRGMGRTLNASEEGLLLEVYAPLDVGQELLVTVGLAEELADLRGRVVHAMPAGDACLHVGIEFLELDDSSRAILANYLRAFRDAPA